jgi:multiple sugar transport system substrate-binding protein
MKRALSVLGALALVFAACGTAASPSPSSPGAGSPAASGSAGPATPAASGPPETGDIVIWIDASRQPAVDAFKKANPDVAARIKETVVDYTQLAAKTLLFNQAGSGWPDVSFGDGSLGAVSQLTDEAHDFPLDLHPYIAQDIIDGFTEGANALCEMPDGTLVCLRNDLAQNVLWYNKPLMDQFGYDVPTTWEEYQALGDKVAAEHPGYVIGGFGGDGIQALWQYFWPGRCPTGQAKGENTVYINMSAPECTRVVKMLDHLIANGAIAKFEPFDPSFVTIANDDKLLMIPAGNWYGEYIFGGKADSLYYKEAKGQLGAALAPKWENEDKAWTGATGGGLWFVSNHTESPRLATQFVQWVTTANEYQGTAPGFPGYAPAAKEWSKTIAANPLYAEDPTPVITEAAPLIDPLWGDVKYARENLFSTVVIAAVNEGRTIESAIGDYQTQLVQLAEASGYTVVTTP